jgi:Tol biopolymer transport system component
MGEVYRARDTRLGRTVALKVLPAELAADPAWRRRLEREAQAISSLSHAHICGLYDLGQDAGVDFLVMEHLEGETLEARLRRGALPLEELLRHAVQIAAALDAAHRQGIVHRDLKPGNIMLTRAGVKLLDFGLARPSGGGTALGATAAPTLDGSLAGSAAIAGTLGYMAPEQLQGKEVDARADLFALGAVLYEMATGRPAFPGDSVASVIAAVLEREPALPVRGAGFDSELPPLLAHLIRCCLRKDLEERWQSAGDLGRELAWALAEGPASEAGRPGRRSRLHRAAALAALLALGAAGGALLWQSSERTASNPQIVRFDVPPPAGTSFIVPDGPPGHAELALSPDGRTLAFPAVDGQGRQLLWLRPFDEAEAQPLPGTEGALHPFWSPDGRFVAFFTRGELKKVDLAGGTPQFIGEVPPLALGGTWSRDGVILTGSLGAKGILRLPAAGGAAESVLHPAPGESYLWPSFLPDGRRFLFAVRERAARVVDNPIRIADLGAQEGEVTEPGSRLLLRAVGRALYADPGYLLFARQGTVFAQSFDPRSATLAGEPIPLAEGVAGNMPLAHSAFSVSGDVLAHAALFFSLPLELAWYDRSGRRMEALEVPGRVDGLTLSPDGRGLAVRRDFSGESDLWLFDLPSSRWTRLTSSRFIETAPIWSPDGRRVAYSSWRSGMGDLHVLTVPGGESEKILAGTILPSDWSTDGTTILFHSRQGDSFDLGTTTVGGEPKPRWIAPTPFQEIQGRFSPDGRWLAYTSDESGVMEVYVQPYPAIGDKWPVSAGGGADPKWRRDGRELFYLAPDGRMMAVELAVEGGFAASRPRALFATRAVPLVIPFASRYEVTPDGQLFLVVGVREGATPPPIQVVLGWRRTAPFAAAGG